jgi:hypothetical protein
MRWLGHVARVERYELRKQLWLASLKGKDQLETRGVDGKTILKWALWKESGSVQAEIMCFR